jgi:hypothetical protein
VADIERKETPTWTQVILDMIEKRLVDMHTAMPGEVISYDYDTNLATVRPMIKRKFKAMAEAVELPSITNVPVAFPRMGEGHLRFPVAAGHEGQIIFQERSIDKWVASGGAVDPEDSRKFHLSDAVFVPGLTSQSNPIKSKAKKTSLELKMNKGYIEITPGGKFKIANNEEELLTIMLDFLESVNAAFTETLLGPQPLVPPVQYQQWLQLIERIKKLKV